jgi:hypothetical protein
MFHMLSLYSKAWVRTAGIDHDLFDTGHAGMCRPGSEIHSKSVNGLFGALGKNLNASVREIANVPADLMTGRGTLDKIPGTDTLNEAADQKPTCDHHVNFAVFGLDLQTPVLVTE